MLEKLALCEKRYLETEQALSDPAIMADMEAYKKYMKEYKSLTPIIEKYREHKAALEDIAEADLILETESDKDLRLLAEEQKYSGREKAESTLAELRLLMIPKDPNDDKNVIMEIRAGAGGEEACLFAAVLYRM